MTAYPDSTAGTALRKELVAALNGEWTVGPAVAWEILNYWDALVAAVREAEARAERAEESLRTVVREDSAT